MPTKDLTASTASTTASYMQSKYKSDIYNTKLALTEKWTPRPKTTISNKKKNWFEKMKKGLETTACSL